MKHFWNSVAIAAVLAIAVPAVAQAQGSGHRPARPKAAHASTGHKHTSHASRAQHQGNARTTRSATASSPSDNVANQLNGQELQRLGTSSAPMGRTAPMAAPRGAPGAAPSIFAEEPRPSGGGNIPQRSTGPVSNYGAAEEGPRGSGGGYIAAPTGPLPMPPPQPIAAPPR